MHLKAFFEFPGESSGPRGRGFKSRHSDQLALTKKMQAKIPHFGAGFLRLKKKKKLNLQ